MPSRVAFCTVPHIGGIYSVYQRMRRACAAHGWDVCCVYPASEIDLWGEFDRTLADEGVVEFGAKTDSIQDAAKQFVDWVREEGISVVVPMSMRACLSAVPHLPPDVHVITRCINVTPHAYRLVTAYPSRTDAIVVTSPRQEADLARAWGVDEANMRLIPNAVDLEQFHSDNRRDPNAHGPLRIGVVDRLEDLQKSIFLVPEILSRLDARGVSWELDVVGAGPDEAALRDRLARLGRPEAVRFHGPLPLLQVAERMRDMDVLLKPSKNEGFPSSVIEAMACGAVPVVTKIAGVTNWIVDNGENGLLCRINDKESFADALARLAADRALLSAMSKRAASDSAKRFGARAFGLGWSALFEEIAARSNQPTPLDWDAFALALPFQPRRGFRRMLGLFPRSIKAKVYTIIENTRSWRDS